MAIGVPSLAVGLSRGSLDAAIRAMFASGAQGAWYDPADFSTLFQDSAGTTPVTATGQPVGKILDKSGRGNHATQATATARPLLQQDGAGYYYLSFDGVDDSLSVASSTALFKFLHDNTGATVHAGYAPSGGAVFHTIFTTGNLGSGAVVGFSLEQDDRTAGSIFAVTANGSGSLFVNQSATVGVSSAGRVVTGINQSASHVLRQNGVVISASAAETGSASTANSTNNLSIGVATAGFPLNGRLYSLIVVGAAKSAGDIALAERFVGGRMGIAL